MSTSNAFTIDSRDSSVIFRTPLSTPEIYVLSKPAFLANSSWLNCFACLSYALKTIPIGNAYAVWTGISAVGVAIVGIVFFNQIANIKRTACIGLIVIGIVGLKLLDSDSTVV